MGTLIPFMPASCITFSIQISLSSIMVAVEVAPTSAVTSTSASNTKSRLHDEDVATDHLLEGKRYMLVKDYANAVESLALACEALSSQHGETASECADAYFHYGKALLELGRMESGVPGNALEGVPEEEASGEGSEKVESTEKMTEDEKEYVGVKVMEAIEENFEQHEEKIYLLAHGHTKGDLDEDDMEGDDSQDDGEGMEVEKEHSEKSSEEKPMEDDDQDDKDEDPSNLQRAWEILELCKNIYTRRIATPMKFNTPTRSENVKKLCDTLLALGEVSMENENYAQAVEDLNSCLEKRKDKLPEERRQIAETMYQLGVALSYHEQFDEAVKYFNDSIAVITKYIETMKADSLTASVSDIGELEKLVPEIREKIQDTMSCKEECAKRMKEGGDGGFSGSSSIPASSIETKRK